VVLQGKKFFAFHFLSIFDNHYLKKMNPLNRMDVCQDYSFVYEDRHQQPFKKN